MISIHGADIDGLESQANDLRYARGISGSPMSTGWECRNFFLIGSQAMEPKKQW
jgi:hypothetical protein